MKQPCDYVKVNKTRRSRGYSFEYTLVQGFNDTKKWKAKRLGGSSSGLPDIVATNKEKGTVYAIECKSGDTDILYIPKDQLDRCKDITDNFLSYYPKRLVVLAFKFKANKKKTRKLHYYFLITNSLKYSDNLKGVKLSWRDCKLTPSFTNIDTCESRFEMPIYLETWSIDQFLNLL